MIIKGELENLQQLISNLQLAAQKLEQSETSDYGKLLALRHVLGCDSAESLVEAARQLKQRCKKLEEEKNTEQARNILGAREDETLTEVAERVMQESKELNPLVVGLSHDIGFLASLFERHLAEHGETQITGPLRDLLDRRWKR